MVQPDLRSAVLEEARTHGWIHETARTPHGSISDQFSRGPRTLTCFWSETPWSDAHWDNGFLSDPDGPKQVWKIAGEGGVLDVLQHPASESH